MTTRLFLTFLSSLAIMFFWLFLGEKAILKDDSNHFSKLQCVSYAPFGKDESPFLFDKGLVLKEENIKKDLELLSKYTSCIRTYSTVGLEPIPKYAKEYNLQMLMGVWVSKSEKQSRDEIETLKKLGVLLYWQEDYLCLQGPIKELPQTKISVVSIRNCKSKNILKVQPFR